MVDSWRWPTVYRRRETEAIYEVFWVGLSESPDGRILLVPQVVTVDRDVELVLAALVPGGSATRVRSASPTTGCGSGQGSKVSDRTPA